MAEGCWLSAAGINTWWTSRGEGESPMVLVHGGNFGPPNMGGGLNAMYWDSTLERLGRSMHVIAYDRPGNGYTDYPPTSEQHTMSFVVEHLIDVLQKLDLGPVHLLGHSRGGYVATRAALLRQDLVKSLTIVTSGTLSPALGMTAVVLAHNPHPSGTSEAWRWVLERYSYDTAHVTAEWVEHSVSLMNADRFQVGVRRISDERLLERLFYPQLASEKRETLQWLKEGRLQRPVQLIWSLTDRTVPLENGHELFRLVARHESRVTMSVADKSGHFPFREVPDWFDATLRAFVSEVEADA
jgi:pimeloyl-ACP methyl ester carboxylesterase